MKKELWKVLALIICLCIALVTLTACGGGEEEEEPSSNGGSLVPGSTKSVDIVNTIWTVENLAYGFDDDGTVIASNGDDSIWGTYEWDGYEGYIHVDGSDAYFAVYSDGSLYMTGEDGYDYLMTYSGELEEPAPEPDPNFESTDTYDLYTNDDNTYTFVDKVRNVSYNCPQWMTVITGGIGTTTDGVVVADNAGGYVVMDNMTNEWDSYTGTDEDFIMEYVNSYLGEFFVELYGDWDDLDYEITGSDDPTHLTAMELNVWNDDWDIQIAVALKVCSDQNILVVSYFAPYDNPDQLTALYNDVVVIGGPF